MRNEKPDLELKPVHWSSPPKQGDVVGGSAILNIQVINKGKAASRACKIQIQCTVLSGRKAPASMNGMLDLSPLDPGGSVALAWPSLSTEKWPAGTFKITVYADSQNVVSESNEANNKKQLIFTIQPKIQVKPAQKHEFKKASPKMAGDLVLMDYALLSVKSDPVHPHTEEFVSVIVKVKNKTPKHVGLSFYFKCKPLDGTACPGGQPGQEIIDSYANLPFNANETRDLKMFHLGNDRFAKGRYLLAAAKDKDFKKSLVFTTMTVQAPEDVPANIRK
jgi:hypothetical protein